MRTILCVLTLALPALCQVMVPLDSQTMLKITTESSSGTIDKREVRGEVTVTDAAMTHRVLRDASGRILFAYDLEVAAPLSSGTHRLVVHPIGRAYAQTLQKAPAPTVDRDREFVLVPGSRTAIELLVQPQTGQKIMDVFEPMDERAIAAMNRPPGATNSLAPDDGLTLSDPEIWMNGIRLQQFHGAMTGDSVGLRLSGKGALFLTRQAPQGFPQFQKMGHVDINGKRLKFTWAGETFEIVSAEPMIPHGGAGVLWVYYNPQYQPKPQAIDWEIASGSVKWLLGNEE